MKISRLIRVGLFTQSKGRRQMQCLPASGIFTASLQLLSHTEMHRVLGMTHTQGRSHCLLPTSLWMKKGMAVSSKPSHRVLLPRHSFGIRIFISRCLQKLRLFNHPRVLPVITLNCIMQVSKPTHFNIHEEVGRIFLTEGFMENFAFIDFPLKS